MLIELTQTCPKQIKWADKKKYVDKAYDFPTIQVAEYDNKLWFKHTPLRGLKSRKPFYVVVTNYMNREYYHILNFAIEHDFNARHFNDAVLDFYLTKIRNWEI